MTWLYFKCIFENKEYSCLENDIQVLSAIFFQFKILLHSNFGLSER